jgi:CDP-diacylglycerol--serine O-phosphatidyltransferase
MRRFWRQPSTESARLERQQRRREQARKGLALLPSALTLGNLVCGFAAIVRVALIKFDPSGAMTPEGQDSLFYAGTLIFLAMVFDALDGRVARLTKSTSDFGAQLDSLCDAVTFGLAPGLLIVLLNPISRFPEGSSWGQAAWVFGVAYACGAILRLARFNVENTHDESAHNSFKGLPSPAAAGVIASLALFQNSLVQPKQILFSFLSQDTRAGIAATIVFALPFVALFLGYLMISRHKYVHVVNVYLRGRFHFDRLNRLLFVGAIFALLLVTATSLMAVLFFCGFAISGPVRTLRRGGLEALLEVPSPEAPAGEDNGEDPDHVSTEDVANVAGPDADGNQNENGARDSKDAAA